MSLYLDHIRMFQFRSFQDFELSLAPGLTLFVGRNAAGKTNTLEAIQLLTTGFSFRRAQSKQLILHNSEKAYTTAHFLGDSRLVEHELTITSQGKRFSRNGKQVKSYEVADTLPSVIFTPDDLSLVKQGASKRREEIDNLGKIMHKSYAKVLQTYQKTLEQRNNILKDTGYNRVFLDALDEVLTKNAAVLLEARLRLLKRLVAHMQALYVEIADGEELSFAYRGSYLEEISFCCTELPSKEQLLELIRKSFEEKYHEDIRRQITSCGPHRDDVDFMIKGALARNFASQGQQRSLVLALKLAELRLIEEVCGKKPLLLLDDVMSELDQNRRSSVLEAITKDMQTIITTTNLAYFDDEWLERAKVISYGT